MSLSLVLNSCSRSTESLGEERKGGGGGEGEYLMISIVFYIIIDLNKTKVQA